MSIKNMNRELIKNVCFKNYFYVWSNRMSIKNMNRELIKLILYKFDLNIFKNSYL
jgi:hypothetical protein